MWSRRTHGPRNLPHTVPIMYIHGEDGLSKEMDVGAGSAGRSSSR